MNNFPDLDWTSPGLHNPSEPCLSAPLADPLFLSFDKPDMEFAPASTLHHQPLRMAEPCFPLLHADAFPPVASDNTSPSGPFLQNFDYALPSSTSSSATNSPGDSPQSPSASMGSSPEQPCGGDNSSETSQEEIKLPPLSPICLLPQLDAPVYLSSNSSSSSSSSAVSGEPLIRVKPEPSSDGEFSPSLTSSPSVPYPPAPTEADKKKKKKGRKRKAPPLLSDLDLNLDDDDDDDDNSNLDKKERNKLSAAKYRKRKKLYIGKLEQVNSNLQATVAEQKEKLSAMSSENNVLKSQLVFFKKLLAQSNISLSDGRFSPSVAKQASAVLFVLFSVFVITTPFWCSLDSPASVMHAAPGSVFHDPAVSGMKGRVLLSVDEVSCECSGKSQALDNLTSLFSHLHLSTPGDGSTTTADGVVELGADAAAAFAQMNATQSHFSPSSSATAGVVVASA